MTSNLVGTILVVDDAPENISLLRELLRDQYRILAATSGGDALELLESEPVDVVLLDVLMPELDGYETCRRIKANPVTQLVPVIFVTAMDSVDHLLLGYEAGGSDYLTKPIRPEELLQKVRLAIQQSQQHKALSEQQRLAVETAMMAMTSSGELGVVLQFMRDSFTLLTPESLARAMVQALGNYGLESMVMLTLKGERFFAGSREPLRPLEQEFLTKITDVGRLTERQRFFIANFGGVCLLVKNMPEDESLRGRLRDHLAVLCEGAESRLHGLGIQAALLDTLHFSRTALERVRESHQTQHKQMAQLLGDVLGQLELKFHFCDLTEEQETGLMELVQFGSQQALEIIVNGIQADTELKSIIQCLEEGTHELPGEVG